TNGSPQALKAAANADAKIALAANIVFIVFIYPSMHKAKNHKFHIFYVKKYEIIAQASDLKASQIHTPAISKQA
ncbi:MAG TPA: hypothetical protein ACQGQW_05335, partial [Xylella fastidiosa subsp. pauca]